MNVLSQLKYPWALALFIPLAIILLYFTWKDLVVFKTKKEQGEYREQRKYMRLLIIISRLIIVLLLVIAVASPFKIDEAVVQGDRTIKILVDNSSSFAIFDTDVANRVNLELKKYLPTTIKTIAISTRSAIGDAVLNNMQGDDNLLLITDGQNNYGRDFGDMMVFASSLNTTVNALVVEPEKTDVSVWIDGPSKVISDTENVFEVNVRNLGGQRYKLRVSIDDEIVLDTVSKSSKVYEIKKKFIEGSHKMKAELVPSGDDLFDQNNVFYKVIRVIEKPIVLLVSEDMSALENVMNAVYDVRRSSSIPDTFSGANVLFLNNIEHSKIRPYENKISDYVTNGGGLVVFGGQDSYDRGDYSKTLLETLLPVKIGKGVFEQGGKVNIMIVMDISTSTGLTFGEGSDSIKRDIEKALAIKIIQDLRYDDNVGVIAFNDKAFVVSPIKPSLQQTDLSTKIAMLVDSGGTYVFAGLRRAMPYLEQSKGAKYMILISDGNTGFPNEALKFAETAKSVGIKTYTVGVGRDTNAEFMKQLAEKGGGSYFEPDETEKLALIFGDAEEDEDTPKDQRSIAIVNPNHFITSGLLLDAYVSGYNSVVPKTNAISLVSTIYNDPILTVWRFGLGRVAAFSTGDKWVPWLFAGQNARTITRTVNWVVGDPEQNKRFTVNVVDGYAGKASKVYVKSEGPPEHDTLSFEKIDDKLYKSEFVPDIPGFYSIFGVAFAINNYQEYKELGMNEKLPEFIIATGGKMFKEEDIKEMVDHVKHRSKRLKIKTIYLRWYFVVVALLIFLLEIIARRVAETRGWFR